MRVKSIKIKNFMSFKDFTWESINPNLNIIVGPNGSGKTNFFNAFRIFSELLNERGSSELLSEIKNFSHLGNRNEKIKLSMNVEFENKEKSIILEFIRGCLLGTMSNRGIQLDSVNDEVLLGFLTVDDITDFFKGDLFAEYDFYSGRWNVEYESEMFQCLIDGSYSGHMLDSKNGEGSIAKLRDKFVAFLKANFKEEQLQHGNIEQIATNINWDGKLRTALRLSIDSNQSNLKSLAIFRNLINDTNPSRGYSVNNLFGWLLKRAFVFTDNIRELPKTTFSSKEIEDENEKEVVSSGNIAYVLYSLKNGNIEERAKFSRINQNFKELTEGLEFDITAKHLSSPIQAPRQFELGETLTGAGQVNPHEDKRDITLELYLQVIRESHEFPLRYSGAGTWEALYFSCLMESKGNIFLLDEPVANVHPTRQKLFSKKFQKNAESQVFISTHSPYITGLENIQKISRFEFDDDKKTTARHFCPNQIDPKTIEIISRSKAATSALFSKAVILVEGETEAAAIPKWFSEYFKSTLEDRNVILISVGSKQSFFHYLRLMESFNIPWAILCDGDAVGTNPSSCEIGGQLVRVGVKVDEKIETLNYKDRLSELNKQNIFSTANSETEEIESMSVFKNVSTNGKSKPEIGYEVAANNLCPVEIKNCFFDLLIGLPRWKNILKLKPENGV